MKIISMIKRSVLLLASIALFAGCNEPDPDSISVVDITTEAKITTIYAGSGSGEYYYKIFADRWSVVSSDESWCIPQKDSGYESGEVSSVYVRAFDGDEDSRTATLVFTSGMATQTIMVSQSKGDDLIGLYPSSSTIDYKAQTLSFMVDSNFDWEVASSVSWVECTVEGDIVRLSVEENESSTVSREAVITVIAYNDENGAVSTTTATYTLTQNPRADLYLTPSTSAYTFTSSVGSVSIDLYTNIFDPAYTVSAASHTEDNWCSATYSDEDGLVITADANNNAESRTATVSVIARSDNGAGNDVITVTIEVAQEGSTDPYISVGMNAYVYEQGEGSYSISYNTNSSSVVVAANCDWITNLKYDSSGVSFDVAENTGASTREAKLTITSVLGGVIVQETIAIYQNGVGDLDLQVSPESVLVDSEGATVGDTYDNRITLTAITNSVTNDVSVEWITGSASWVSIVASGKTATLTVDENTDIYERECNIIVKLSAGDQTIAKSVTVTQKCKSLDPSFE